MRLQWNSYRITHDPDPRLTKEFSMINALHSGEQQDDLPLLTEKAARLPKQALPGPGGCYLQRNLQSDLPHLTGAPILCQPSFVSHYLLSPFPPSPELHLSPNKPAGQPWVCGRTSSRRWAARAKPARTPGLAAPPVPEGLLGFYLLIFPLRKNPGCESSVAIGV